MAVPVTIDPSAGCRITGLGIRDVPEGEDDERPKNRWESRGMDRRPTRDPRPLVNLGQGARRGEHQPGPWIDSGRAEPCRGHQHGRPVGQGPSHATDDGAPARGWVARGSFTN